jgi:hypothetical protein
MKVILRPLVKDAWSGIIKYRNCHEDISSYFTRSGRLYTGLTDSDAKRLGDKLGYNLAPGSEFWKSFFIRTSGKDMILETEEAMDELRYLFLKSHKRVKNSVFEHKATANFVLINEQEEARKSNVYNKAKRQAMREMDRMSTDDIKKALRLYGKRSENMTAEVAENRLFEIIDGDPQGFVDKWVNNQGRETQYLIERAVSENIIRRNKRQYSYGTEVIGYGIEDAIAYLEDPKNQELKITIKAEIESKNKLSSRVEGEALSSEGPSTGDWAKEAVAKATAPKDNVDLKAEDLFDKDPVEEIVDTPKEEKKETKKTSKK